MGLISSGQNGELAFEIRPGDPAGGDRTARTFVNITGIETPLPNPRYGIRVLENGPEASLPGFVPRLDGYDSKGRFVRECPLIYVR